MRAKKFVQSAVSAILSVVLLATTLFVGMPVYAVSYGVEDEALIPSNLHCPEEARTASEVTLLWDKPEGIYDLGDNFKTYVVYVNGKQLETAGDITTMGYSVTGLDANTTYEFTVKTQSADGTLSGASNSITVTTKPVSKVLNVLDYGAVGDGTTKDTAAIQSVIDSCEPGDTVLIPEGYTFLSGALFLKSDMTLKVDGTLLGSLELEDYPVIPCMFEGRVLYCYASLITIGKLDVTDNGDSMVLNNFDCTAENITICGTGEINGRGFIDGRQQALVQIQRNGPNLNKALGETDANRTRGRCVAMMNAKNVYMRDVTVSYGPAWTVHSMFCDNITFDNVKFIAKNEMGRVTNGDGYDPESTTGVNMFNCYFRTGDDAVAIKSGKNLEGVTRNKPSYNIRITDCLIDEAYGGFVIGSEMSGGVYNVLIQNCTVKGITSEALHVKSSRVRGGYVRDVVFKDITIDGCSKHFMLNGTWGGNNDTPPSPIPPVIENIVCENVVGINATEGPMEIRGLDTDNPTINVTVRNCSFDGNGNAMVSNAENINFTYSTKINGTVAETDTKAVWVIENCDLAEIHGIYPQHIIGRYGVVLDSGAVLFEGETAPKNYYVANGGTSTANDNNASGGAYWQMNNGVAVGDYAVFDLYGLPVGRYSVEFGYKLGGSRAAVQASLDGTVVAESFDMYGAGLVMAHETIGEVTVTQEGLHQFRLDVVGKNEASSRYDVIVDYLKFIPLDVIPTESITLTQDTLAMDLFETERLTHTILPANATDRSVVYTTSNASVATVSGQGLVTAVSPGEAIITVTTNNGGYSASCVVTVGSWNPDIGDSMIFEGETAQKEFAASGATSISNDNNASGGAYWQMNNGVAVGDYVVIDLYGLIPGKYSVEYGYKLGGSRAMVQASLDDSVVAEVFDMYGAASAMARETIGEVTITQEGLHQFRLDVIGKNEASSRYDVIVDYLKFTYNGPAKTDEELGGAEIDAALAAAKAAAEKAQAQAQVAQVAAEAARKAAEEAAMSSASDKQVAEAAVAAAKLAQEQAQAARDAAEKAQKAAEAAAEAAEESNADAAKDAAAAAESAAESAGSAAAVAAAAQAAADAARTAQKAQEAAEKTTQAAVADREAAANAREDAEKAAQKAAAESALNLSKTAAVMKLNESVQSLMMDASAEKIRGISEAAKALRDEILAAESETEIAEILETADEALGKALCAAAGFTDVNLDAWYHDAIDYVVGNGMMNGTGEGIFAPETALSRAMLVQILYNIEGKPAVETAKSFSDVAEGAWYYDAVMWAAENEIVLGNSDGTYAPDANVTREQMVTILWRYVGKPEVEDGEIGFADSADIDDYAQVAVAWAVENEIVKGMGENQFNPDGNSTRAQTAQVMMNYFKM